MKGVNKAGAEAVSVEVGGRYDKFSPSLDELTGIEMSDRDGAIVALSLKCDWSPARLARLFDITERRVYQIVSGFKAEFGGCD